MKAANDAASRNGLSKLHLALKKVVGEAGTARRSVEEEKTEVQDSLLEDLLNDEDMEL